MVVDEYTLYSRRRPGRLLPLPSRDDPKIRREVLLHEGSPVGIEGSCVRTAKETADWLFVEENEKPAVFLVAMQCVTQRLELSRYGL